MERRKQRWIFRLLKLMVAVFLIVAALFSWKPVSNLFHNVTGEIEVQSSVLRKKLESSKRLEVTKVDEEGTLEADTSVIILGKVGSTTIRYRYTASLGIDLEKVIIDTDSDSIIFSIPDPEVLNDGIEALEVKKRDFFSKAIDKSVETLLYEQRIRCREQYLNEKIHSERIWTDTIKAFNDTLGSWLDGYGERHYQFEFVRLNNYLYE